MKTSQAIIGDLTISKIEGYRISTKLNRFS